MSILQILHINRNFRMGLYMLNFLLDISKVLQKIMSYFGYFEINEIVVVYNINVKFCMLSFSPLLK